MMNASRDGHPVNTYSVFWKILPVVAAMLMSEKAVAATVSDVRLTGVSTAVESECAVMAAPIMFGAYSGVKRDATTTIAFRCTVATPYSVGLTAGSGTGATVTSRKLTGAKDTLAYSMFLDPARTANWGQTEGTDTFAGMGNGSVQSLTVYGRIAAGQFVTPGTYMDVIDVLITY